MDLIEAKRIHLMALETEKAMKTIQILNNEREIKLLEYKLSHLRLQTEGMREILKIKESEVIELRSEIDKQENVSHKEYSSSEPFQQEHPLHTDEEIAARRAELDAEDLEAINRSSINPVYREHHPNGGINDFEPHEYDLDSDMEAEIAHRMKNW